MQGTLCRTAAGWQWWRGYGPAALPAGSRCCCGKACPTVRGPLNVHCLRALTLAQALCLDCNGVLPCLRGCGFECLPAHVNCTQVSAGSLGSTGTRAAHALTAPRPVQPFCPGCVPLPMCSHVCNSYYAKLAALEKETTASEELGCKKCQLHMIQCCSLDIGCRCSLLWAAAAAGCAACATAAGRADRRCCT